MKNVFDLYNVRIVYVSVDIPIHSGFIRFITSFAATIEHFQFMNEFVEPITNIVLLWIVEWHYLLLKKSFFWKNKKVKRIIQTINKYT